MIFGRKKFYAMYIGDTELYDKIKNKPPIKLVHGSIYRISVQLHDYFMNGWTIVRIYDPNNKCITEIPYAIDYRRFWKLV